MECGQIITCKQWGKRIKTMKIANKLSNNKGRGSGLYLIIILIVALIVAWLAMTQMKSLDVAASQSQGQEQVEVTEDPEGQVQDVVDAINNRTQEAVDAADAE